MTDDIRALADLQFRRSRRWMPFAPGSDWKRVAANQVFFVALSLIVFRDISDLTHLYLQWIPWMLLAVTFLAGRKWLTAASSEWELSVPRPRMHLMMGWFLGSLRFALHVAVYVEVTVFSHYGIGLLIHRMSPLPIWEWFETVAVFTALTLGASVPAVGMATLFLLLSRGRSRVLAQWLSLFGFMVAVQLWGIAARFLAPSFSAQTFFTALLGILGIGWPLTWLMLRLAASIGLRRLGDMRLQTADGPRSPRPDARPGSTRRYGIGARQGSGRWDPLVPVGPQIAPGRRSAFWSLFRLETKRLRVLGRDASPRRRLLLTIGAVYLVVLGFASAHDPSLFTLWASGVAMLVYSAFLVWGFAFPSEPIAQGWGEWWLSIPHSRWALTGSRGLAMWSTFLTLNFAAAASLLVGAMLKAAVGFPVQFLDIALESGKLWFATALLFTTNFLLFHIRPALQGWLMILLLPLYAACLWIPPAIARSTDPWGYFWLYVGLGLPVGIVFFGLGGRFLNRLSRLAGTQVHMRKG